MVDARHQIGQRGEDEATRYLQQQGYSILSRNWRDGRLELDIICKDGDTLVFVEVKTRAQQGMTAPYEALSKTKQRTLIRAAQSWLAAHNSWQEPCRFDLVCVTYTGTTFSTEHTANAFDLSQALGGGNTAW